MAVKSVSAGAYCTSLVYWSLIVQSLLNDFLLGFMLNELDSCNLAPIMNRKEEENSLAVCVA